MARDPGHRLVGRGDVEAMDIVGVQRSIRNHTSPLEFVNAACVVHLVPVSTVTRAIHQGVGHEDQENYQRSHFWQLVEGELLAEDDRAVQDVVDRHEAVAFEAP